MDLLKWIGLKKQVVPPTPDPKTAGFHGDPYGWYNGSLVVPWSRCNGRKKLEEDLVKMDENSPIIARMLDKTADYATSFDGDDFFGFKVDTAQKDGEQPSAVQRQAVEIINQMVARTELSGRKTWDVTRSMVLKGNVFGEVVIDPDLTGIVAVRQFRSSWQIEKHLDDSGNLKSGDPAVAKSDPKQWDSAAYTQIDETGKVLAAFWPYQIVHWAFGPMGGREYAEPVGGSAVKTYKRFEAGIDSLGVARIIRAWDTNIHVIPMPAGLTPDEVTDKISQYRQQNERDEITAYDSSTGNFESTPRYSPVDVARDLYVPAFYTAEGKVVPGDIRKLQPSTAALQHLEDLEMQIALLVCAFCVPQEVLGIDIGSKPMVDKTKEEGMEAFSKYVKRLQFNHAEGLKQIFDLELILNGIDPRQLLYKIIYPRISPRSAEVDAKILVSKGQTASYWYSMGVPPELIGPMIGLDTDAVKLWRTELEKKIAAQAKLTKPQPPVK